MFALIDCNNFFASCERLFKPILVRQPVIILSNNDGCVIARSNEAKALGIKMGVPYFQVKALCKQFDVHVFSSNYILYGDISRRVMSVIEENWPEVEIYSIDEAFLNLKTPALEQHDSFCATLQKKIFRYTGIPVSIGIGPTKTSWDLTAKNQVQLDIFNQASEQHVLRSEKIMALFDVINRKYGRYTLHLAAEGHIKPWSMRAELRSPNYTTQWSELPIVTVK